MKNITKTILSTALILVSLTLQAQEPNFDDNTQDVPVNNYIPLLILAGIGIGLWFYKKKQFAK